MSRKSDIRKASREAAKMARAQQSVRVDELERSVALSDTIRASRADLTKAETAKTPSQPICQPISDDGVVVKLRPRRLLEGV
jgi:hypothetical protein